MSPERFDITSSRYMGRTVLVTLCLGRQPNGFCPQRFLASIRGLYPSKHQTRAEAEWDSSHPWEVPSPPTTGETEISPDTLSTLLFVRYAHSDTGRLSGVSIFAGLSATV
jgi:hypothetical protein